jgi:hypothetical protein
LIEDKGLTFSQLEAKVNSQIQKAINANLLSEVEATELQERLTYFALNLAYFSELYASKKSLATLFFHLLRVERR